MIRAGAGFVPDEVRRTRPAHSPMHMRHPRARFRPKPAHVSRKTAWLGQDASTRRRRDSLARLTTTRLNRCTSPEGAIRWNDSAVPGSAALLLVHPHPGATLAVLEQQGPNLDDPESAAGAHAWVSERA